MHVTLVIETSFRAVGQKHVKWQTSQNYRYKRQMYGGQSTQALLAYK